MRALIRDRILTQLGSQHVAQMDDSGRVPAISGPLAVTTDSFVVSPIFFPGGDIGSLAVHGTVNDLAVSGATPLYLTLAFIIEEGLPLDTLDRVLVSIATAAREQSVDIIAGDTKVVPRGAADGIFINTTGVGRLSEHAPKGADQLESGDEILVSGPIGRHGTAILCARDELGLMPPPESDSCGLSRVTQRLMERLGDRLVSMRDATRGGVAAVLHEWAEASGHSLVIEERAVPVSSAVRGACELLGIDPLHVANEGTMVLAVRPGASAAAIEAVQALEEAAGAKKIGQVTPAGIAPVAVQRLLGPLQPLDDPVGAPLPRIC